MVFVQSMPRPHIQPKNLLLHLQLAPHRHHHLCLRRRRRRRQHRCHRPLVLNQVTVETSPTARVTRLAVAFSRSLTTALSTVAVNMRMLSAAPTPYTAVLVITPFVTSKKGSASRAKEITWECLQASDIWLSTSFHGLS